MPNSYPAPKSIAYWQDRDPQAITLAAQASPAVLGCIRAIGNSQRIDYMEACQVLFKCKPEELCWQAASSFIAWLKSQPKQLCVSHATSFCPVRDCHQLQTAREGALCCSAGHSYQVLEAIA